MEDKKMDKLLFDFILLYFKLNSYPDKLNYYDKCLIDILNEFSFLIDDRKYLMSKNFLD